jgi:dTDP-4-dehydrorhamnose 3,5-epimerase
VDLVNTDFEGLFVIKPDVVEDHRGWFLKAYSKELFTTKIPYFNCEWVQINHSFNKQKGTWRGFHYQESPCQEYKLIRCISGSVIDYALDIRNESKTFMKVFKIELSDVNRLMILIPKGFAHGFLTKENNSEILYFHDQPYAPKSEMGILYNDPYIKSELNINPAIISERDKSHKLLNQSFKGI